MTNDAIISYISKVFWRTSLDGSHQYTLRSWKSDLAEMFNEFVLHIRQHGYVDKFMGEEYIYFNVGGAYRYWSMGAPLEETILINRAKMNSKQLSD